MPLSRHGSLVGSICLDKWLSLLVSGESEVAMFVVERVGRLTYDSFACATFIATVSTFGTDFIPTPRIVIGIYAAVLVGQGLINTFGVHLLRYLNNVSVWWHALGTTALVIAILAKAPTHQSGHFVFRTFIDGTGVDGEGWSQRASPAYVVIIGILMAQYTLTGMSLI